MIQTRTIATRAGASIAAVGVAALVAACGSSGHANSSASASGTPASDNTLQISIVSGKDGRYLAGAGGRALYLWVADSHNKSHCSGACAAAWPPLLVKTKPSAGSGVKASDIGTIARGSERQVTYAGHPLYYFAGDRHRGTTTGQGSNDFGAKWWLVGASGAAITHGSSSKKTTSSGGSGSGW